MSWYVSAWNAAKAVWSGLNNFIMGPAPRRPVPLFASPRGAASYLVANGRYVADPGPVPGAFDFYTHPERGQAAMETGDWSSIRGFDCDDWAAWAYAALRQIPGCTPQLLTLRDDAGRWGHHVICVYEWRVGGSLERGAIDTNGHRLLPDLSPVTLCRVWSEIYASEGYRYGDAVETAFPF